jgi:hypothetical protein
VEVDWEEWLALTQQNPVNLTEKGRTRLVELENKFGLGRESQMEGHLESY